MRTPRCGGTESTALRTVVLEGRRAFTAELHARWILEAARGAAHMRVSLVSISQPSLGQQRVDLLHAQRRTQLCEKPLRFAQRHESPLLRGNHPTAWLRNT